jgi:hypothetical protein
MKWLIKYQIITSIAAALLAADAVCLNRNLISIFPILLVFFSVMTGYNAYRFLPQYNKFKDLHIFQWPTRFKIRASFIIFPAIGCFFVLLLRADLRPIFLLGFVFFLFYSASRFHLIPPKLLIWFGYLKAPLLALSWFVITSFLPGNRFFTENQTDYSNLAIRFVLLLLIALANDIHDRDKDIDRGVLTWAVRLNKWQMLIIGYFLVSTTFFSVLILNICSMEFAFPISGVISLLIAFSCFYYSFRSLLYHIHIWMMDGCLIICALSSLFENYLRNLLL